MPITPRILLRWLHRLLLTANLIILCAIFLLWPFSYFRYPSLEVSRIGGFSFLCICKGRIAYYQLHHSSYRLHPTFELEITFLPPPSSSSGYPEDWSYLTWESQSDAVDARQTRLGITTTVNTAAGLSLTSSSIAIPLSYFALILSIYPLLTYRHWRKTRHLRTPSRAFPL